MTLREGLASRIDRPPASASGGVRSISRAFAILELIAEQGGVAGLTDLTKASGMPLGTIHRMVRTLVDLGYLQQDGKRRYYLGPRLVWLGESSERLLGTYARPHLAALRDELEETANLAMLDGDRVIYVAQVPSRHSMRMFTEVGRRAYLHTTAVGKAVMSQLDRDEVRAILDRTGMKALTANTIVEPDEFISNLEVARQNGFAVDDGEQEIGVRCFAVPVLGVQSRMALSISGPAPRMTDKLKKRAVARLMATAEALANELNNSVR
jgi:IclR family acetate operon transcriptional repressor